MLHNFIDKSSKNIQQKNCAFKQKLNALILTIFNDIYILQICVYIYQNKMKENNSIKFLKD